MDMAVLTFSPYQPARTDRGGWHLINLALPREAQLKVHLLRGAYFTWAISALTNKRLRFLQRKLILFVYLSKT